MSFHLESDWDRTLSSYLTVRGRQVDETQGICVSAIHCHQQTTATLPLIPHQTNFQSDGDMLRRRVGFNSLVSRPGSVSQGILYQMFIIYRVSKSANPLAKATISNHETDTESPIFKR